jgi:taurine dioxygenase
MSDYRHIDVRPIAGALGAEVHGVDLKSAKTAVWSEICAAFLDRLVLFFPKQDLSAPEIAAAGAHFGELGYYPFVEGLKEEPYVIPLVKEASERKNFGEGWHSDTTYTERPPMATALYSVEVPEVGGDTMFANMYLAYETLSDGMKEMLAPLRAANSSAARKGGGRASGNSYQSVKLIKHDVDLEGIHPVIRTHPETARKALYVNALHTTHFVGWSREESKPILEYLYRHKSRPEFTCRYAWSSNTFAIWDNRAAQHFALNDYHGQRREMRRLSVAGEVPV